MKKLFHAEPKRAYCSRCNRPMPKSSTSELCKACEDDLLYTKVKEYILSHDVTEMEVAEAFDIPLSQVRSWVKDGRIEYRRPH